MPLQINRLLLFVVGWLWITACAATPPSAPMSTERPSDTAAPNASAYILPPPATAYGPQPAEPLNVPEGEIWHTVSDVLGDRCILDGGLTRAARKHAADLLENPSMNQDNGIDYLRFALRYFGNADYLVSPAVFELDAHGNDALLKILGNARPEWTHCGIGVYDTGDRRQAVFMAATRILSLNKIPVQPSPGKTVDVRGSLMTRDATEVAAFLEHPDGSVQQLKTFMVGTTQFQTSVPLLNPGIYKMELQVTRGSGPETAMLLPLFVGVDVESRPSVFPAGREPVQHPRRTMATLLNRIRKNQGLTPLERDARLDEVAQRHCEDMAASSTFGHFSRSSGGLSDRLQKKGLYPRLTAENIGLSSSMMRVHHNLMQSPSHKIKVLTPAFTHLGLGIVTRNGVTTVTQVFAAW